MTNNEEYLASRLGKKNVFSVPDGYFDSLAANVMSKIPEQRKPALLVRLRPLLYAAACVALAVFVAIGITGNDQQAAALAQSDDTVLTDDYLNEAADYALIDNYEIYACLVSE